MVNAPLDDHKLLTTNNGALKSGQKSIESDSNPTDGQKVQLKLERGATANPARRRC